MMIVLFDILFVIVQFDDISDGVCPNEDTTADDVGFFFFPTYIIIISQFLAFTSTS